MSPIFASMAWEMRNEVTKKTQFPSEFKINARKPGQLSKFSIWKSKPMNLKNFLRCGCQKRKKIGKTPSNKSLPNFNFYTKKNMRILNFNTSININSSVQISSSKSRASVENLQVEFFFCCCSLLRTKHTQNTFAERTPPIKPQIFGVDGLSQSRKTCRSHINWQWVVSSGVRGRARVTSMYFTWCQCSLLNWSVL